MKTFFGERKQYALSFPISTTLLNVVNHILEQHDSFKRFCNTRVIYPMGTVRQLNLAHTLEQAEISNHAELLMLVQTTFHFDIKGDGIKVILH